MSNGTVNNPFPELEISSLEHGIYECAGCKKKFEIAHDDKPECPFCSSVTRGHKLLARVTYALVKIELV